uniref:Uncharacterized protein n=1 Tax=Siphoviridae sp. ctZHD14 TaxID=2827891 RepID=A0A8S5SVW5_9CAUD|nr:MAG TPA: hypothetical protein [Siphoviridae sp. ctZHD14]
MGYHLLLRQWWIVFPLFAHLPQTQIALRLLFPREDRLCVPTIYVRVLGTILVTTDSSILIVVSCVGLINNLKNSHYLLLLVELSVSRETVDRKCKCRLS